MLGSVCILQAQRAERRRIYIILQAGMNIGIFFVCAMKRISEKVLSQSVDLRLSALSKMFIGAPTTALRFWSVLRCTQIVSLINCNVCLGCAPHGGDKSASCLYADNASLAACAATISTCVTGAHTHDGTLCQRGVPQFCFSCDCRQQSTSDLRKAVASRVPEPP